MIAIPDRAVYQRGTFEKRMWLVPMQDATKESGRQTDLIIFKARA